MEKAIPAIDMWAPIVPTPEIIAHVAGHFPETQLGYLRVFWKQAPTLANVAQLLHLDVSL